MISPIPAELPMGSGGDFDNGSDHIVTEVPGLEVDWLPWAFLEDTVYGLAKHLRPKLRMDRLEEALAVPDELQRREMAENDVR